MSKNTSSKRDVRVRRDTGCCVNLESVGLWLGFGLGLVGEGERDKVKDDFKLKGSQPEPSRLLGGVWLNRSLKFSAVAYHHD
jgi:hypothetical protein